MTIDPESAVFIIDDDLDVRRGIERLLASLEMTAIAFASTSDFLESNLPDVPSCLVLDVRLRGVNGLDFQEELKKIRRDIPVIFLTGYGDISMTVRALKAGAIDFLEKPFRGQELIDAINAALDEARKRRAENAVLEGLRERVNTLSARERDVMKMATRGLMNKQIAAELGVSEITVKVARGHLMQKLGVRTLAALVRAEQALGIDGLPPDRRSE